VILISNLTLSIKDGSTIASTEIYGVKTYVNTGSGNIFNLEWETPTLTNDTVDSYGLVIKRYDPALNVYYDLFSKNVGQVNEFYVDSPILPIAPEQYMLSVYLVAYGKRGSTVTSDVINPYVIMGSGTYVNVKEADYAEPIMKRALGLVNATQELQAARATAQIILTDSEGRTLTDIDGIILGTKPAAKLLNRDGEQFVDSAGRALFAPATKLLESTNGWVVVQKGYTKDANGTWRTNDITYEVLQVLNEQTGKHEALVDFINNPIYIL